MLECVHDVGTSYICSFQDMLISIVLLQNDSSDSIVTYVNSSGNSKVSTPFLAIAIET